MSCMLGVPASEAPYAVLEILGAEGWEITIVGGPARCPFGVEVTARRGDHRIARVGHSVADVVLELLEAARHAGGECGP